MATKSTIKNLHEHPFHLVNPSPWPLVTSLGALMLTTGGVLYMHSFNYAMCLFGNAFIVLILSISFWFGDVIHEAKEEKHHTTYVQQGLKIGIILFITSEVMFFFGFFWAFFHSSLSPDIAIGAIWPPKGIDAFNPWEIPFLNTVILLTSGATVTWAHHALFLEDATQRKQEVGHGLLATVLLGVVFTFIQGYEYIHATFTIADGIYGSVFYMATGFHGFHVLIGTTMLIVCAFRNFYNHFTPTHHIGFEASAWYWHFVDVVWLFLFITIYWWGS